MGLSEAFYRDYMEHFGAVYEKLPRQVIHRDPNPGNIITGTDKWGFIEFELSERNVRIFDPCYSATAILSESFQEKNREKLAIPFVILSNQLICVAWLSEQDKYQDIYRVNVKMTKWLMENMKELQI